jgi:hypothetical protein
MTKFDGDRVATDIEVMVEDVPATEEEFGQPGMCRVKATHFGRNGKQTWVKAYGAKPDAVLEAVNKRLRELVEEDA